MVELAEGCGDLAVACGGCMFLGLFFNLTGLEVLVVLAIALFLFRGRLPEIGRSLARTFTEFKRGTREGEEEPRDT